MKSLVASIMVLGFVATSAAAQNAPRSATLRIQVIDSVGSGALPGAFIVVKNSKRTGTADASGRVQIDSIPPGTYTVEVLHPLLDSLGIRLGTPPVTLSSDETVRISIPVPTPLDISRLKCPGNASSDYGAITGFITEANGVDVVPNAMITLTWSETAIGKAVGVHSTRVIRNARAGSDGRYIVCNVPTELSAQIVASQGNRATSPFPLVLRGSHYAVQSLAFAEGGDTTVRVTGSRGTSAGLVGRGSVSGLVRGPDSRPVVGAAVAISGGLSSAQTDSTGHFMLGGAPSGTQTLQVRKIGFEGFEQPLSLLPGETRQVEVTMQSYAPILKDITVRAVRDRAMDRIGFTRRKSAGFGYYVTPEEIDRRNAIRTSDLLREIPLLRVTYDQNKAVVSGRQMGMSRNCLIFLVDGVQWRERIDDFVQAGEVGAIEIYSANRLPNDVSGANNAEGCEMVIIWTKVKLSNP